MSESDRSFHLSSSTSTSPFQYIDLFPNSDTYSSFLKTWNIVNCQLYKRVVCSISGGSDSDVLLDIISKCDIAKKVSYLFVDTGLEYQATRDHLSYLEERYGVSINRIRGVPVVKAVKDHGQPFLSKQVSCNIERLQSRGFQWEDEPLPVLVRRYCDMPDDETAAWLEKHRKNGVTSVGRGKNAWVYLPECGWARGVVSALMWWCNAKGAGSRFNIDRWRGLKQFLIAHPPSFQISDRCCSLAKKSAVNRFVRDGQFDLSLSGVRVAEGGARSTAYRSCYTHGTSRTDSHRPLQWYSNADKAAYCESFGIVHSLCYEGRAYSYGLTRTGCCGCPFSQNLEAELEACRRYEPRLLAALYGTFGESYEYTRLYYEFREAYF